MLSQLTIDKHVLLRIMEVRNPFLASFEDLSSIEKGLFHQTTDVNKKLC